MALVVWASFWWKAVSKSDTCFLQQASMDALVVSRHPMALSISSCSWSTSSERVLRSIPGWVLGCWVAGTLVTLGVSDARVEEGEWLSWMASSGLATCGNACWEVATSFDVAKTGQSGLSGSSSLIVNGVTWYWSPQDAVPWGWARGVQHHLSSAAMLVQLGTLLVLFTGGRGEESGVEALQGPWKNSTLSLGIACGRSTWSCRLIDQPTKGIHIPHG